MFSVILLKLTQSFKVFVNMKQLTSKLFQINYKEPLKGNGEIFTGAQREMLWGHIIFFNLLKF